MPERYRKLLSESGPNQELRARGRAIWHGEHLELSAYEIALADSVNPNKPPISLDYIGPSFSEIGN